MFSPLKRALCGQTAPPHAPTETREKLSARCRRFDRVTDRRTDAITPEPARWVSVAAIAVTLLLWASAFVAIRHLGHDFSPGALSLGRLGVGTVALGVVALSRGLVRPSRTDLLAIIAIGVLWFGIYNIALNEGERRVDAGTASMLLQVSPVLIAVLAATFLRERFTRYLAIGLFLAFAGVAVIGLSTSPGGHRDALGVGLCLVSALVYSISMIVQKPLVSRLPAVQVTWLAATVGLVVWAGSAWAGTGCCGTPAA